MNEEAPHSIEAEQSVLGCLLLDNQAWDNRLIACVLFNWEKQKMNQEQLRHQKIEIIERTPRGVYHEYICNGLLDALVRFESDIRDDDYEQFNKDAREIQFAENVSAEDLAKMFNKYTENVVHVEFVVED